MTSKILFKQRRDNLMAQLPSDSVVILASAPQYFRNRDSTYPYRQQSDFYYLTGFCEPEALALLIPGRKQGEFILFNRPRDPEVEAWDGPRAGQEGAKTDFGAGESFAIAAADELIPKLLSGCQNLFCHLNTNSVFEQKIRTWLSKIVPPSRFGPTGPSEMIDLGKKLHLMRMLKSSDEVAIMRKAIDITGKAHLKAMQTCRPGMYEYELEAVLLHEFIRHGARFPAYESIVAAGENACVLHYVNNRDQLKDGELVLIDAGCEYEYYSSDITRTFPVNGKFTAPQRAVYECVLAAQAAVLEKIKPGLPWIEMQNTAIHELTKGLVSLDILQGDVNHLIKEKAYRPFYMHGVSHWMGLDVHDVGPYQWNNAWQTLRPGMVMSCEPGLYIKAGTPGVDKKWWNIGVRIEDDVLVTETGHEVLSVAIPKSIQEIEYYSRNSH